MSARYSRASALACLASLFTAITVVENPLSYEEKAALKLRRIKRRGCISDALLVLRRISKKAAPIAELLYAAKNNPAENFIRVAKNIDCNSVYVGFYDGSAIIVNVNGGYYKFTWVRRSAIAFFHSVWQLATKAAPADKRLF